MDLQDTVVDRSLDRLLSYWYIFSCLVEIPPIAYLAIWYLNLSTYEILIFFPVVSYFKCGIGGTQLWTTLPYNLCEFQHVAIVPNFALT